MPPRARPSPPPPPAVWEDGLRLRGSALWFDARRACELSFVSDASRMARHRRILCTDLTAKISGARGARKGILPSPFGRALSLGPLRLELFPSGRALGAAQVLVEKGTTRFVYCGGVQPNESLTAERFQVRPCDVLLLDCPYDSPGLVFPPRGQVRESIVEWVRETSAGGKTPVLLAAALGTGQELLKLLGDRDIPVRAHQSIYDIAKRYRELGVALAHARRFRSTPVEGEAVIFPIALGAAPAIRGIEEARIALVSGRAALPAEVARSRVDASFPLSSHADGEGLLAMVRATGAKHVVLSPRHGAPFEKLLRRRGLRVTRFSIPEQLGLLP
ncbi:MAG: hypothetical protein HYY06_28435 [Deltaproteobacteria bacterium]|nr:hypothetical protein [Deltaproteobacteria bacterium]